MKQKQNSEDLKGLSLKINIAYIREARKCEQSGAGSHCPGCQDFLWGPSLHTDAEMG